MDPFLILAHLAAAAGEQLIGWSMRGASALSIQPIGSGRHRPDPTAPILQTGGSAHEKVGPMNNEVLLGGLLATLPIGLTQAVQIWQTRTDRKLERTRRRRDDAAATLTATRARYEEFLEAAHQFSAYLTQAVAVGVRSDDTPVQPVPQVLIDRLSSTAVRAALGATGELEELIASLHAGLIEAMRDASRDGASWAQPAIDADKFAQIRKLIREDLTITARSASALTG